MGRTLITAGEEWCSEKRIDGPRVISGHSMESVEFEALPDQGSSQSSLLPFRGKKRKVNSAI